MVELKVLKKINAQQMLDLADSEIEKRKLQPLTKWLEDGLSQQFVIGAFIGSKLVGVSCLYFANKRPWGSLVYLKINTSLSTTARLKILIELVDESFRQAEERNCCRVYMVNNLKRRGVFKNAKLFPLVKRIKRLQKYNFMTEALVKAGAKPEYQYEWELMGFQVSDEDIGIVSATRMAVGLHV